MQNLVFGIITTVICGIGYLYAFKLQRDGNVRVALALLLLCGLFLRLYTGSDLFLHPWDERYHALVAKHMIDQPFTPVLYENPVLPFDYRNWAENHYWVHKQPLPLWSMAVSMALFGINEIALRLPSILLSTLGIGLTFSIGKNLFGKEVGFMAAFLFSIHGLIIEITAGRVATDHIDLFFLIFVELAVLMAIKFAQTKKPVFNILCGVSIGFAILSKWLPALVVLPIWLMLVYGSKKFSLKEIVTHCILLGITLIAISLPWQIYIYHEFTKEWQWENYYNTLHFTHTLDTQSEPLLFHFYRMPRIFGELVFIPVVWFLWKLTKKPLKYHRLILAVWFLVPFLFFTLAATKMQAYTLFTAPALFIIIALFWVYLKRYLNRFKHGWMVQLLMVLLLVLPIRYSFERIKPFDRRDKNPKWAQELRGLDIDNPKTILFNEPHYIEAMFYNNCLAYPNLPNGKTLDSLKEAGYDIRILHSKQN